MHKSLLNYIHSLSDCVNGGVRDRPPNYIQMEKTKQERAEEKGKAFYTILMGWIGFLLMGFLYFPEVLKAMCGLLGAAFMPVVFWFLLEGDKDERMDN